MSLDYGTAYSPCKQENDWAAFWCCRQDPLIIIDCSFLVATCPQITTCYYFMAQSVNYLNILTNCFKKGCFQKLTLTSKKKMRGLLIFFDFYEMVVNQMIRTKWFIGRI